MVLLSCFFLLPWGFPARRLRLVWKEPRIEGKVYLAWNSRETPIWSENFCGFLKIFLANLFMKSSSGCIVVGLLKVDIIWQNPDLGGLWAAHNFLSLEKNRRSLPTPSTQLKPGQFLFPRSCYYTTLVFPRKNGFVKISAAFPPVSPGRTSDGQKNSGFFFFGVDDHRFPFLFFLFLGCEDKKNTGATATFGWRRRGKRVLSSSEKRGRKRPGKGFDKEHKLGSAEKH